MNWDAIGAVGEIVGAAAVVATLGYLAVQTRQSNNLARSNAVLQLQAENRAHRNSLAHDKDLSEIVMKGIRGEELSDVELFRFTARSDSSLSFFESVYLQFEAGIIAKEDFSRYEPIIRQVAKMARDRGIERRATSPGFQTYVEGLLNDA